MTANNETKLNRIVKSITIHYENGDSENIDECIVSSVSKSSEADMKISMILVNMPEEYVEAFIFAVIDLGLAKEVILDK